MSLQVTDDTSSSNLVNDVEGANSFFLMGLDQIKQGSTEVVLSKNIDMVIGAGGAENLAKRFEKAFKCPVTLVYDQAHECYRFLQPPLLPAGDYFPYTTTAAPENALLTGADATNEVQAHAEKSSSRQKDGNKIAKERANKISRPANAFILYRKHHHYKLKAQDPTIRNCKISQIVGAKWRDEDPETTKYWKGLAKEAQLQHKIDHPDYHYQPRKPGQKQRRNKSAKPKAAETNVIDLTSLDEIAASVESPIYNIERKKNSDTAEHQSSSNKISKASKSPRIISKHWPMDASAAAAVPRLSTDMLSGNTISVDINPSQTGFLQQMFDQYNYSDFLTNKAQVTQGPASMNLELGGETVNQMDFEESLIDWDYYANELSNFNATPENTEGAEGHGMFDFGETLNAVDTMEP